MTSRLDLRRAHGASAVEYALLVSGLAAVIAVAVFAIGRITASQFSSGGACLTSSTCSASPSAAPRVAPAASPSPTSSRKDDGKDGDKDEARNEGKDD